MASQTLIDRLRRMTAVGPAEYTVGGDTHWTDADLDGVLEERVAARLIQIPIELRATVATGAVTWVTGRVRFPGTLDAEQAVVVDWNGNPLAGVTTTVHEDGRVEFDQNVVSNVPLLSGLAYDLNGAAADVLTEWAAFLKLDYDVQEGGALDRQALSRSQRHAQLLKQAEFYKARALPGSIDLIRTDHTGRRSGRLRGLLEAFERVGRVA